MPRRQQRHQQQQEQRRRAARQMTRRGPPTISENLFEPSPASLPAPTHPYGRGVARRSPTNYPGPPLIPERRLRYATLTDSGRMLTPPPSYSGTPPPIYTKKTLFTRLQQKWRKFKNTRKLPRARSQSPPVYTSRSRGGATRKKRN